MMTLQAYLTADIVDDEDDGVVAVWTDVTSASRKSRVYGTWGDAAGNFGTWLGAEVRLTKSGWHQIEVDICPHCDGYGLLGYRQTASGDIEDTCSACKGRGVLVDVDDVDGIPF